MTSEIPRFAVVSHYVPPSRFGQPQVLYRLLRRLPVDRYGLLSITRYDRALTSPSHDGAWLEAPYFHLETGFPFPAAPHREGWRHWPRQLYTIANLTAALHRRAKAIETIVRDGHFDAVVACSGDPVDLPASALAARRLRVPFIAYMFDDYGTQYKIIPPYQRFAAFWDRVVARRAACVVVPNEKLQEEYVARHNARTAIVRNPHSGIYPRPAARPDDAGPTRIVYTGAVYHAQEDAFARLIRVLATRDDLELHLYSSVPTREMPLFAGARHVTHFGHVDNAASVEAQAAADILFLPLAFNSPAPDVIRTALPGKFAEYLASAQPMLVHAPAESFVAWYCRRHDCAMVVDEPDEAALGHAIERLRIDRTLRARLVAAALGRARNEFDPSVAERAFIDVLRSARK